ncbi:general transcription factor IIF subunit 1-like [Biomphalaria glabrata]|uniref:Transcription initiation factor IIF subunit alpha n=1 Tax=Biomphalaria glabrata TaxID=6526 RepID=A0A9W3AHC1_BIOGL|nr:general transcription factor IIF subunit 1-like [Biomphalaria glabrata]
MSSFQGSSSNANSMSIPQEEFIVRIPRDTRRKFTMMKMGTGSALDFAKLGDQPVKIERENNLKEYKTANDLDLVPKFGAGSEYGKDLKEESRRKKYGIMLKKYNPEDQPWHLKVGSGKSAKRYKGVREGTITENTSYYIFTKASDGAFEAFPVEEWYNFTPVVKYKYLNSEEAEEEYSRRDKTFNYFSIMVKKRLKKEDETLDEDEKDTKGKKKGKKAKDLILTDKDDWDDMEMSDDDDDSDADKDEDDDTNKNKKKKQKGGPKKVVKNSKKNSDDEAVEESDEGDFDDKEVDYMSDSGSSSSLSDLGEEDKDKKYDEKGVDQEAGLRNILDSDAEDEEEEGEKEEADEDMDDKDEKKEDKKKEDDSSSSSSEDDSDIEKDAKLASAIFLQGGKKEKKDKKDKLESSLTIASETKTEQRIPTPDKLKDKSIKRRAETPDGKTPSLKKHKTDDNEGITEDAIRRYLMRKPMTTKDLLQKFKSKKLNMTNEKITHVIAQLLKKINPEKKTINKKLYLSLKKPE